MRTLISFAVLVLCAACKPDFATVEEACDDKVPGTNKIHNSLAIDVFARINCYRRLAKLSRASMDPKIQEAVENHSDYVSQNFVPDDWTTGGAHYEESGKPGFTGVDAYDRLEDVGYPNIDRGTMGIWDYAFWDDEDAVGRIDFWFHDPQAREAYLQLAWLAGGYDEGELTQVDTSQGYSGRMAYMNIFYSVPVRDHTGTAVIYPKDGQEEVPTAFMGLDPQNPMTGRGIVGYPITAAVGSLDASPVIEVGQSSLTGPDGTVELEVYTPATDSQMRNQVAFYPMAALAPNSEYTFEVTMTWGDQEDRTFSSTFRTGDESMPHGDPSFQPPTTTSRGIPSRPIIRHRVVSVSDRPR